MAWRRLPWVPLNVLQTLFVGAWTAACVVLALVALLLTRRREVPLAMARRLWAPVLLAAGGVRLEGPAVATLPRPCYLVSNHGSLLDVPVLFAGLPVPLYFVAKAELARVPFLGWYMRALGMPFVERGRRGAPAQMAEPALAILRRGDCLLTFPAGTRGGGTFKAGGFAAAIEAGVPVVPVAVAGTARALPPGGIRLRPARVRIRVGAPIPTAGLVRTDRRALAQRAEEAVTALLG